jgi:uroporphyrinogen-III synthase
VLAEFILYDYNEGRWTGRELGRVKRLPLLFLVGETRRDVIPKTLTSAPEDKRIDVCELVVYETCVVDGFREEFRKAIEVDSVENQNKRENACSTPQRVKWVVVFSPTGADVALEVLNEGRNTFLAAIGPTTEKHLENTLARRPDVVAGMPTPEGLWRAIDGFMEQLYG